MSFCSWLSLDELHEKVIEWEEQLVNIPKEYNYRNLEEILNFIQRGFGLLQKVFDGEFFYF